jgi:5'-nucleotidase
VFVTAGVLGNLDQKLAWLHNHKLLSDGRHMKGVIFAYDKDLIRAQALIDDGPHNIQNFGGLGIVWDAPYNKNIQRKHYRVKSWKDLPELWGKLYG